MFRSIGAPEIALIVIAVILVFGVGKLAGVGGALGKSIREFRREVRGEKDKVDDTQQSTTRKSIEEKGTPPEAESKEKNKD
jgi:sec-independent protein translocase protein TatA